MNDPWTRRTTGIGQLLKMKKESVNDRCVFRSGPGMDHQSCRLLNDGDVLILIIDLERDLLSLQRYRLKGMEIDFDDFPSPDPVSSLIRPSLDSDAAGTV
jgi:hypothetical protein